MLTPSPVGSTATSTVALPPEDVLKYRPLEIASSLPPDVKPTGALLVWGEQPHLLRFDPQIQLENFSGIEFSCLSTSPDGKWLAYCLASDDSPTGVWLIVESADRQQRYQVSASFLFFNVYEWLDNQRLIFPLGRKGNEYSPMVVINPFTGEQTELVSDYPGMSGTVAGPMGRMAFEYSSLVYDPSLNLVIFPEIISPQRYIVLWDRQSNTALAKVEDKGEFLNYPLWSPDAKQFVVAVLSQKEGEKHIEEWFSVSRVGQVERLTYFGDYFVKAEISNGNWSPDGQKLAFWLETTPSLCPGAHLVVLEMMSKQATDTCIPGTLGYVKPPIWFLDSRYISVVNVNVDDDSWQAILVDYEQGRAFDITEYGVPVGWLALP
jgi:hypothetical protein